MNVLTVFIDGLKPESIEYMPFLRTFDKRRVETDLGYSVTCHATMYSSVYPNKHLRWFLWKYSPETSPFKWLSRFKSDKFQNDICSIGFYKFVTFLNRNSSIYGYHLLWYIPIKNWHYFDFEEKKFWTEKKYLETYPPIFDILKYNNIPYETVGLVKKGLDKSSEIIEKHVFNKIKPWTYLFIGDIDPLSHMYGQDSTQVREKLRKIDNMLEKKYKIFEKECGNFCFMLFSDHGHIRIKSSVDLKYVFKSFGESLDDYIYFIDANYARFWFRSEKERRKVLKILSEMFNKGFILTKELLLKYNVNMPDNRYGDLIFYLDAPYNFTHGVTIAGRRIEDKTVSGHGYVPNDGVFISNKKINKTSVELVDILPSILHLLKVPIPTYVDGEVVWK
jgi:hypothetical protein